MIKREDIKYRIQTSGENRRTGGNYAKFLIYIDARTAQDELDIMFGALKWSFYWERVENATWAVQGYLKVYNPELKEWVSYSDVGYPSDSKKEAWDYDTKSMQPLKPDDTDWLKDAVSDAFKRCAVQVGVGRFLYDAPFLYTEEVKVNDRGKVVGLTDMGKQMIEGNIKKWYDSIYKSIKDGDTSKVK